MIYVDQRLMWGLYRRSAVLLADLRDSDFIRPMLFDENADLVLRYDELRSELLMFGLVVPSARDPWPEARGWLSDSTMAIALHRVMRRMELTLAPPDAQAMPTVGMLCC
jgi:hypothetical protein